MVASRSSSERLLPRGVSLALFLLAVLAPGCVIVRPEEREYLADSSMTFGAGGEADGHGEHILTNREGSAGAGEFSGGGCGCN